jgi:type IV pilus assembly protein PilW
MGMIKKKILPATSHAAGFTLVELMVTLFMSTIIMAAVYSSYLAQQRSYATQDSVAEMQQNLRAAMLYMTRDIREAGCDPTGLANAKIIEATPGAIHFSRDIGGTPGNPNLANGIIDSSPGLGEDVMYGLSNTFDADGNGIADGGTGVDWSSPGELRKNTGAGFQSIADSINAIEFNYILTDNTTTTAPTNSQLNSIVGVQISLLARAPKADREFTNNMTYTTAAGTNWGPFNDNFRRRLNIATIQLRNQGM